MDLSESGGSIRFIPASPGSLFLNVTGGGEKPPAEQAEGGALVLIGFQARLAALALVVLTVLAKLIFHDFWSLAGAEREMQFINFLKNLSMIGGLLLVVGFGSGPLSLDRDRPD